MMTAKRRRLKIINNADEVIEERQECSGSGCDETIQPMEWAYTCSSCSKEVCKLCKPWTNRGGKEGCFWCHKAFFENTKVPK